MITTERTAVGRRLSVRRTAYRPPWSGRKAGHSSIVAPFALRLAASVAVGVGVALARAERDRRAARARRARERHFSLLASESLGAGLQRMALGQLDLAIEMLDGQGRGTSAPAEHAVHETRKALKRLRALVRLLRDELGAQAFARENALLRDSGRRLASARDAEVMAATFEQLLARRPAKLARRPGVRRLRTRLQDDRVRAAAQMLADGTMRARVLGDLRVLRARVVQWSLSDDAGIGALEPALERLYRQGRGRMARAAQGSGDHTRAMHRWRKRVKDLRYVAELLNRAQQSSERGKSGKRGKRKRRRKQLRGASSYLRGIARQADDLGELLGEEHDLAVLAQRVRAEAENHGGKPIGRKTHSHLLRLIARRRKRLRKRALRKGGRLYGGSPKKFVRRVRRATAT